MTPAPVFLFSAPRAGSTWLQRLIGSHPDVCTLNEPWFLLPLIYMRRRRGISSEYWQDTCGKAVNELIDRLDGGEEVFDAGVRAFAGTVHRAAAHRGERYFLDKTPRYALIVDDIERIFPDAKLIFLWRNPLSIISSMIEMSGDRWLVPRFDIDLIEGIPRLVDTAERLGERALCVRYEDLLEGLINFCNKHDPASTKRNARAFLTRLVTSWVGNDEDLHAKNMSILAKIDPVTKKIRSIDFSPTYDLCPSTLCGQDGGPMFYNLNKKKGQAFEAQPPRKLNMNQWMEFMRSPKISVDGKKFCIFDTEDEAKDFMRDIASKVAYSAVESFLNVPPFIHDLSCGSMMMLDMQLLAKIACSRAASIGAPVPDIDFDPNLGKTVKRCGAKARRTAFETRGISDLYTELAEKAQASGLSVSIAGGPFMPVGAVAFAPQVK